MINVQFMTDDAIETLRANIPEVTKRISENPYDSSWLQDFVGVDVPLYETKNYLFDDFSLNNVDPDNNSSETKFDNAVKLYEHLKGLPASVLSNEKFWLWLYFDKLYSVATSTMIVKEKSSVFKDHWLHTQGNRRGLFFGVLSRFYFMVKLTKDESLDDPYFYTKFCVEHIWIFYYMQMRAIASNKDIFLCILRAVEDYVDKHGCEIAGKDCRELGKAVSKLGSVKLIDVIEDSDVESYVYKALEEIKKPV